MESYGIHHNIMTLQNEKFYSVEFTAFADSPHVAMHGGVRRLNIENVTLTGQIHALVLTRPP